MPSELESDLWDTVDLGREWLVVSSAGKTQLVSFDWSLDSGAVDVNMDVSVLSCWDCHSLLIWIVPLTFSQFLKLPTRKWKPWFVLWSFFLLRYSNSLSLLVYLRPYMKYCCHVLAGTPNCYLDMLDKLQKQVCRTIGPSLATSLEPLAHRLNAVSLSLFYMYYFDIYLYLNWLNWFRFLILVPGPLVILIGCIIFPLPFLGDISISMSTVSFLAQLNSGILYLQNPFIWPII